MQRLPSRENPDTGGHLLEITDSLNWPSACLMLPRQQPGHFLHISVLPASCMGTARITLVTGILEAGQLAKWSVSHLTRRHVVPKESQPGLCAILGPSCLQDRQTCRRRHFPVRPLCQSSYHLQTSFLLGSEGYLSLSVRTF